MNDYKKLAQGGIELLQTAENVHYGVLTDLIKIFQSIDKRKLLNNELQDYNKLQSKLYDIYPEKFN